MFRLVVIVIFCEVSRCLASEFNGSNGNWTAILGHGVNNTKDGLSKRNIKTDGIIKGYDPPPEYYRGPDLSSHPPSSYTASNPSAFNGHPSQIVAFPGENYDYKPTGRTGGGWFKGSGDQKGSHDRISVAHYDSSHSDHDGGRHGGVSSLESHPYGPPQAVEYDYYGSTGHGHSYSEGNDAIPVEFYNRGYGGYGHSGDYSPYPTKGHFAEKHNYDKALLAKSFLIPLASAAVLGIAAALATNPVLLQLGAISSVGKRKKREINEADAHSMAYRTEDRN